MREENIQANPDISKEEHHEAMKEMECRLTLNHLSECRECEAFVRRHGIVGYKFIGIWTRGMMELSSEVRESVEKAFNVQAREKDDWFYVVKVQGKKYFVAENGEFGYTAMLPGEY